MSRIEKIIIYINILVVMVTRAESENFFVGAGKRPPCPAERRNGSVRIRERKIPQPDGCGIEKWSG